ncbi:3-hydroxyisobutyryl-CoA hydrolase, mitochondrial [Hondaea fermentalgiana]|uniref:3-hydroxyisobutyryl-CoA hydrolase n=1 Tax=Hondaea fermentalgiana TaxID=2315210 RepID=A0A2R5H1U1_9STRA|nr:3-hydroxyisobutyryl-CoA hydrolase, mitochondrial [Hondaea fermentalgiana]|eukprot:GBG34791.1 3-hydroxyisobutyryl-CoA hydrolase, mitochondrial [Hondaea fermentalgiana]
MLNKPKKLNALDLEMVRLIMPEYDAWVGSGQHQCIVMRGAGEKAFCAGGDIASVRTSSLEGGSLAQDFFYEEYQLNYRIATAYARSGIVQVSFWDGITMGGGVGLSLHGKVRVATEKTLFAMPETGIGLFPDVGGTFALSRLAAGPEIGMYLALTGCRLGAADCMYAGLTTHYVPHDDVEALVSDLEECEPEIDAIEAVLQAHSKDKSPPAPKKDPHMSLEARHEAIKTCFRIDDSVEAILERLDNMANDESANEDDRTWAKTSHDAIMKASPTSVCLSYEAVRRHAQPDVDIGTALTNEYRLTQRICVPDGDFFEGVRAVLVDRDQKPQWKFDSIQNVPQQFIQDHFEPLPESHSRGELRLS